MENLTYVIECVSMPAKKELALSQCNKDMFRISIVLISSGKSN